MGIAFWVCGVITGVSAAVSLAYAILGLRAADGPLARTASRYALSRSIALLFTALAALPLSSVAFAAAIALAMVLVQALDAVVGAFDRERLKTIGPAATAVANLAALIWMLTAFPLN